ncbi:50S ribosomal protein L9 [bacterium]|nr:50S ribosomal protein L9 [bacterium]
MSKRNINIVLMKSVDNLGQAGDTVKVAPGYFRNFLEPRSLALRATAGNLKLVDSQRKRLEALVAKEKDSAERIKSVIDGQTFTFKLRAGDRGQLFGSINSRDLVDAIKETHNIEIERRRVDMASLKTLGAHSVRVRVYPGVTATLTAVVEKLAVEGEVSETELEQVPDRSDFGSAAKYEDED